MSVPRDPFISSGGPPGARRKSVVIYGEEDGHVYVTIKTEVTIELRDPEEVDALDATLRAEAEVFPTWRMLNGEIDRRDLRPEDEN